MRILVANRGEIACRIIKAIKELNHESVAIYSTADKDADFVKLADINVCIGKAEAKDSYLNMQNILITATALEVDAIHPGYGFLSENAKFAELCEELKIIFIGPTHQNISLMGNKISALKEMQRSSEKSDNQFYQIYCEEDLQKAYEKLSLPLIIKYASGGGGKGMRIVTEYQELISSYNMVLLEAKQMEQNPLVFAEKFITDAKHIEVQVVADKYGNKVAVGTRDCSMQRNSQKVIEEAPANISKKLENALIDISLNLVENINYVGVGTVEFLVKDNKYYFLEMNTRLQVEHTVTEEAYGIDLVQEQIKIALGEQLSFDSKDIKCQYHSIECRINAEDPNNNFAPTPGLIEDLKLIDNDKVRNDFGASKGSVIPPYYDSMIGKIIVKDQNRDSAIDTMQKVLEELRIVGIKTNINFNKVLLEDKAFRKNIHTTMYIKENYEYLKKMIKE